MTPGGWITLVLSIGAVTSLFAWCTWKIMHTPNSPESLRAFNLETHDEDSQHSHE